MIGPRHGSILPRNTTQRQEKTAGQTAAEGADRLSKFGSAVKDKSKGGDMVSRIQEYSKSEQEKKKKADEEKKKKPATAAPEPGFFSRMYDKYVGGKK